MKKVMTIKKYVIYEDVEDAGTLEKAGEKVDVLPEKDSVTENSTLEIMEVF